MQQTGHVVVRMPASHFNSDRRINFVNKKKTMTKLDADAGQLSRETNLNKRCAYCGCAIALLYGISKYTENVQQHLLILGQTR